MVTSISCNVMVATYRVGHGSIRLPTVNFRRFDWSPSNNRIRPFLREEEAGDSWQAVSHVIAKEVLALIDDGPSLLSRIQRIKLIPLELRLTDIDAERSIDPFSLLQSTRQAIRAGIPKEGEQ